MPDRSAVTEAPITGVPSRTRVIVPAIVAPVAGTVKVMPLLAFPPTFTTTGPVVANIGNFHSLAFHFFDGQVVGLFEHHTGELTSARLAEYVAQLSAGSITNEAVFADKGHGALVFDRDAPPPDLLAVTGPRRALLVDSGVQPHLAVPHGDMMLTGNLGLLRAYAGQDGHVRAAVERRLGPG